MGEYGVHESWSKLFSVQFENAVTVDFFGCTSCGEVLIIKGVNPQSKGEQRCNMIVLLDLETSHEKNLVSKTFRIWLLTLWKALCYLMEQLGYLDKK